MLVVIVFFLRSICSICVWYSGFDNLFHNFIARLVILTANILLEYITTPTDIQMASIHGIGFHFLHCILLLSPFRKCLLHLFMKFLLGQFFQGMSFILFEVVATTVS